MMRFRGWRFMGSRARSRVAVSVVALGCMGAACTSGGSGADRGRSSDVLAPAAGTVATSAPPAPPPGQVATGPAPGTQTILPPNVAGDGPAVAASTEGGCGAEITAPAPTNAIDIIWVVDASVSMLDEQQRIGENLTRFADTITAAALDVRIFMLTTAATIPVVCVAPSADPAANTALNGDPRYSFIESLVDSKNPLDIALLQFSRYGGSLRPDATTHFIFVSDDEAGYGGLIDPMQRSATFQEEMKGLLGHPFYVHTISSPGPTPCIPAQCAPPLNLGFVCDIVSAVCTTFAPGLSYWQLAEDTGGIAASICETDWSQIFEPLTEAIVATAPLPCTYEIPPPPLAMTFNADKVNVAFTGAGADKAVWPRAGAPEACGENLAWYFEEGASGRPRELSLCPAACALAKEGGALDLSFGCEVLVLQ